MPHDARHTPDQPFEQPSSLPRRTPQKAWCDTTEAFPISRDALLRILNIPLRTSPAAWDAWYVTEFPKPVTDLEAQAFHRRVRPCRGARAVDLACGAGQWTRQLAVWGLDVTGYDYSPEALTQARRTATSRMRLSYHRWDINTDPIPAGLAPNSVDLVTCRLGLPYLDAPRVMTDIGRWLRSDGTFYALVRHADDDQAAAEEPFRIGMTDRQIAGIASGWASAAVYRVGDRHRGILLRGYGIHGEKHPPDLTA